MLEVMGEVKKISTSRDGGWIVTWEYPGDTETGLAMAALATMMRQNLTQKIEEEKP